jgi:Mn-dependent DtxR family transcriptional regulator
MQRAHRLWETYQTTEMGIDPDLVHLEAEYYEHHLNDDIISRVDDKLGYPETDPHGSPIPRD